MEPVAALTTAGVRSIEAVAGTCKPSFRGMPGLARNPRLRRVGERGMSASNSMRLQPNLIQ